MNRQRRHCSRRSVSFLKRGIDKMKEKKKMSLAMQIFIALVLAIIAGQPKPHPLWIHL